MPKRCPNRLCRAEFTQQCHGGYLPNDCFTVWAVMKCHVCRDTFMIRQNKSDAWEYHKMLPHDPNSAKRGSRPINRNDIRDARRALERDNVLAELYERKNGLPPGELHDEN